MGNLVFTLLDMSLAAGWVALIVMVLRFLLKKAPHALVCALWALVAVRLICPITWQAPWSLMPKAVSVESYVTMSPSAEVTPSYDAQTTVTVPSQTAPPVSTDRTPTQTSETPTVDGFAVAAIVWMVGVVGMLAYAVVSTVRLRRQVRASVRIEKGIYECDAIAGPFILGLLRPRIYLPSCMTQAERDHVIAHERAHIKRLDHAIKPFGFLLLSIYWFHPLLWLAYALLCRDMELACDERVIRQMNGEDKASYSEILLKYSLPQRAVTACPLGFSEGSVKTRIRAIVNYKKPTFWIVAVAVSALLITGFCFLFNRPDNEEHQPPAVLSMPESIVYEYDHYDGTYTLQIHGDGETALTFLENEEDPVVVNLSQEQIVELNTLYDSIEDFTSPYDILPDTVMTVDGETFEFFMMWTTQVELEQYMRLLQSYLHNTEYNWFVAQYDGEERWNERMLPYAYESMEYWMVGRYSAISALPVNDLDEIEAFDGNVYQYFARFGMDYVREGFRLYYASYRSEDEVLTVCFDRNGRKRGTERKPLGSQGLPDEIVISDMYWAAPTFTVTFTDNGEISFAADYEEVNKIVPLTPQEFDELRQLFVEIYDYRSLFGDSEENGNTLISYDGNQYRCDSFFTTQVELEQFLGKIKSYYTGEEYDWRVEQERGYIRYNERMLPYAYKDMEFWMEWGYPNISSLPVENLGRIETFDGNVYEYFCNFGMDYVRKDGDCYYACYRSEDEVLKVFFDRQGTKLETKRSPL